MNVDHLLFDQRMPHINRDRRQGDQILTTGSVPPSAEKEEENMIKKIAVINDLSGSDFEQISFVSDRNANVELVQFVMQTEGIQIPEETDIPVEEEPMSFWQRLLALFGF